MSKLGELTPGVSTGLDTEGSSLLLSPNKKSIGSNYFCIPVICVVHYIFYCLLYCLYHYIQGHIYSVF